MGVPPTVTEPATRGGRAKWALMFLAAVLVGAAIATALVMYFRVWRYQPTAQRHIPSGANIALRADANKILLFKPVRQHLWPLALEPGQADPDSSRRMERIKQETGVALPLDLREVLIASMDAGSWVMILGGNIEPGRFVAGLDTVLKEEGLADWKLDGELLKHAWGPAIGQAEDGSIVVGTNVDITMAALPEGDEPPLLPESSSGALSFVVNETAYRGAIGLLPLTLPGLDTLDKITQVHGDVLLSEEPSLELRVTPKAGQDAAALASELDTALSQLRLASLLFPDVYGAKQALAHTTLAAKDGRVTLSAPWPYAALDQAARDVAELLRRQRGASP